MLQTAALQSQVHGSCMVGEAERHTLQTHLFHGEVLVSSQQVGGDEALPRSDLGHEAVKAEVEDEELPALVHCRLRGVHYRAIILDRHGSAVTLLWCIRGKRPFPRWPSDRLSHFQASLSVSLQRESPTHWISVLLEFLWK